MRRPRTWDGRHRTRTDLGGWGLVGVWQAPCGCWTDTIGHEIWEPCPAHEGDGHLAEIGEEDGLWVARCLVAGCRWQASLAGAVDAVTAAQQHWRDTRMA